MIHEKEARKSIALTIQGPQKGTEGGDPHSKEDKDKAFFIQKSRKLPLPSPLPT